MYVAQSNYVFEYNTPLLKTAQSGSGDETADNFIGQNGSLFGSPACDNFDLYTPAEGDCFFATGVFVDTQGRLYVGDSYYSRVLRYETPLISGAEGRSADLELGQQDLMHGTVNRGGLAALYSPGASAIDANAHLYVVDGNSRVLGWHDVAALTNGASADLVIGQPDAFFSGCTPDPTTLCRPAGVAVDPAGNLYVADATSRVLEYDTPFSQGQTFGQLPNLIFGQGGANTTGCDQNGLGADSLCDPGGLAFDSAGNLYVADTGNSRVLEYNTPMQKTSVLGSGDTTADHVIGQNDFLGFQCADGRYEDPRPSASGLCRPTSVVVDASGNVFVADTNNDRVLEYTAPLGANIAASGAVKANLVFGQSDFKHVNCVGGFRAAFANAHGLCEPTALTLDKEGNLYVADSQNNRVLEYFTPLAVTSVAGSGDTTPDAVLGQSSFRIHVCHRGTGGGLPRPDASGMCSPAGLSVDADDNLYISDNYNNRVLRFSP